MAFTLRLDCSIRLFLNITRFKYNWNSPAISKSVLSSHNASNTTRLLSLPLFTATTLFV